MLINHLMTVKISRILTRRPTCTLLLYLEMGINTLSLPPSLSRGYSPPFLFPGNWIMVAAAPLFSVLKQTLPPKTRPSLGYSADHLQRPAKRSADFVKQQPGRARQKS